MGGLLYNWMKIYIFYVSILIIYSSFFPITNIYVALISLWTTKLKGYAKIYSS